MDLLINLLPYVLLFGFFVIILRRANVTQRSVMEANERIAASNDRMADAVQALVAEMREARHVLEEMRDRTGAGK